MPGRTSKLFSETSPIWPMLLVAAVGVGVALHHFRLRTYTLYKDDFAFVARSMTIQRWKDHFWDFHSQHWMPVFHTVTALLCQAARSLTDLPAVLRLGAVAAYTLAAIGVADLAYLLCGSRAAACAAAMVFCVTSVHASILQWYAASCVAWSIAFSTLALSLWIRHIGRGGITKLAAAVVGTVLAFGSWSAGVLLGPVLAVTLAAALGLLSHPAARRRAVLSLGLLALLTTGWVGLLQAAHPAHRPVTDAEGRPVGEVINVGRAVEFTLRRVSEQTLFGNLGVMDPRLPRVAGMIYGAGLFAGLLMLWRRWRLGTAPVWTGLAWMALGFAFPMLFRWRVGYGYLRDFDWYGAWPQCGAALVAAALAERALRVRPGDSPPSGARLLSILIAVAAVLFLAHEPIATDQARPLAFPRQRAQLAELELIADAARHYDIAGQDIRKALGRYRIDGAFEFDGLDLLDLPDSGRRRKPEEVRALLRQVLEYGMVAPAGGGRDR